MMALRTALSENVFTHSIENNGSSQDLPAGKNSPPVSGGEFFIH